MKQSRKKRIIALAFFHRYGWICTMLVVLFVLREHFLTICGSCMMIYSIWTFIGYKRKWSHIYCSYQNMCHKDMTPSDIHWNLVKKKDFYGMAAIDFVLGATVFIIGLVFQ